MAFYKVMELEQSLVIYRTRHRAVSRLLFFVSVLGLMLAVPVLDIFVYHSFAPADLWLAILITVLFLPVLIPDSRYLVEKQIVLDKQQNQVLLNGQYKCALSDVHGIKLGEYIYPNAKNLPFRIHGLYLETENSEAVEIERLIFAGPSRREMKEVGLVIAKFARVYNNLS